MAKTTTVKRATTTTLDLQLCCLKEMVVEMMS
jgi:hypothetical protein